MNSIFVLFVCFLVLTMDVGQRQAQTQALSTDQSRVLAPPRHPKILRCCSILIDQSMEDQGLNSPFMDQLPW